MVDAAQALMSPDAAAPTQGYAARLFDVVLAALRAHVLPPGRLVTLVLRGESDEHKIGPIRMPAPANYFRQGPDLAFRAKLAQHRAEMLHRKHKEATK